MSFHYVNHNVFSGIISLLQWYKVVVSSGEVELRLVYECECESYLGGGMWVEETGKGPSCMWGCLDRERSQLYVELSRLGVGLLGVKFSSCLVGLVNLSFDN